MAISDIYAMEQIVEPALASILGTITAGGIQAFSSQDPTQFQKIIPRVEIQFNVGAGQNRFVIVDPSSGAYPTDPPAVAALQGNQLMNRYRRESAWACSCQFALITAANITDHNAYRAMVRASLASLNVFVNEALPRHELVFTGDGGNTPMQMSEDKAYFKTDFVFNGKISVQADAWTALAA